MLGQRLDTYQCTKGPSGQRDLTENNDLRQPMLAIFSTPNCKKINEAPSVRIIVIWSDHRLLWRDSDKDVDCALTLPESIMHKIIIIIASCGFKSPNSNVQ